MNTKLRSILFVFALVLAVMLFTISAPVALADTYNSPATVTATGTDTLVWTGQGTTNGALDTVQCSGDTPNPGDLLWIFTFDGATLGSPDPMLHLGGTGSGDFSGSQFGNEWHFVTHASDAPSGLTGLTANVTFNVASLPQSGSAQMNLTISHGCPGKATPTIVTTPNPADVTLGTTTVTLNDSATLSNGNNPTGTITFTLYDPSNNLVDTETVPVSGNGTYSTPTGYTLPTSGTVTGTYQWVASYSGDGNNNAVSSNKGDEPVVVRKADPQIVTTPNPASGTVGVTLNDSANLSNGYYETGSITFKLFAPSDATCSGSPAFTNVVTVNGNGTYNTSAGFVSNATGTWHWTATYSGDGNNNAVSSNCADEAVTIFNAPLTPGYWKTHLAPTGTAGCDTLPSGTGCSNNGPWTSQYLPQYLGNYKVDTFQKAAAVFNAMNCSSTSSQNAIGCLAGHLLAAELNVANGSDPCIVPLIAKANTFLTNPPATSVSYGGYTATSINYVGPSGNYSGISSAQRNLAIAIKNVLDTYNNGGGCTGTPYAPVPASASKSADRGVAAVFKIFNARGKLLAILRVDRAGHWMWIYTGAFTLKNAKYNRSKMV